MILPMGRPVQMIPFWSFRGQHHITRGTGLTFAVSMYVVNVLEVLNAHIDMRCLKPGSYLNRTSKIVTMGMWWWQCIYSQRSYCIQLKAWLNISKLWLNWIVLFLWSWLWLNLSQCLPIVTLWHTFILLIIHVLLAEASR